MQWKISSTDLSLAKMGFDLKAPVKKDDAQLDA